MSPNKVRIRVRDYLLQQDAYVQNLRRSIAIASLQKKRAALGISSEVTQSDVELYITTHYEEIEKEIFKAVTELVKEAIPNSQIVFILKNIGVLSIFILPPFYPLSSYICELLSQPTIEYSKIGSAIVSIILLCCIFIASFIAFLQESLEPKTLNLFRKSTKPITCVDKTARKIQGKTTSLKDKN